MIFPSDDFVYAKKIHQTKKKELQKREKSISKMEIRMNIAFSMKCC